MNTLQLATATRLTVQDVYAAKVWGFTDWQWCALTDAERADYRDRIAYADNFSAEGK